MTSDLGKELILLVDLTPDDADENDGNLKDENDEDRGCFDETDSFYDVAVFHMRSHHSKREGSSFERKRSTDRLRCQVSSNP